tara:strand:- start:2594 stop:3910 length:1317 start_codon:yes stop_codon:yes gene_type:complete
MKYKLIHGDSLKVLSKLDDNTVHSVVTDPPYGISFMGKKWDYDVPTVDLWREVFRVLKPGGHLLSFAGSKTYHRMAVNIEDAGFEIRDQIMWVYGSGFPKSMNIAKAIDKKNGFEGDVIGTRNIDIGIQSGSMHSGRGTKIVEQQIRELSPQAKEWDGWGTALKPAHEPIVVARKPLIGTIIENVLEHGTGGLNIDGCRIELMQNDDSRLGGKGTWKSDKMAKNTYGDYTGLEIGSHECGRFPANFIHDGSDEVVNLFPQSSTTGNRTEKSKNNFDFGSRLPNKNRTNRKETEYTDSGSVARFFYCAKASKQERNKGFDIKLIPNQRPPGEAFGETHQYGLTENTTQINGNNHPTVKPVDLMKYLCRLVTPPNGIVLDPFMGSGTTGIAATVEGFQFIGIELSEEYMKIADTRISHWVDEKEELIVEQRKQRSIFDEW